MNISAKFYSKIWIPQVYFKGWIKGEDRNFLGTKSWRNCLEGLKRKVDIFIGTKNILNTNIYHDQKLIIFHQNCGIHKNDNFEKNNKIQPIRRSTVVKFRKLMNFKKKIK